MPLSLAGEFGLQTPVDQFGKIDIFGRLTCINRQDWSEKQHEQKEKDIPEAGENGTGLRCQHRSPALVINEPKLGQGLDAWQWRR